MNHPVPVRRAPAPLATWGGQTERTFYLGIDPGFSSGSASLVDDKGRVLINGEGFLRSIQFEKATEHEIDEWFAGLSQLPGRLVAALEKVRSMPGQGVASTFKFAWSYGFLRGLLTGRKIRYLEPTPQEWQGKLKCLTKGDKRITRARAQERWPSLANQINNSVADSLLIADWLRLYGGL